MRKLYAQTVVKSYLSSFVTYKCTKKKKQQEKSREGKVS